MNPKSGKPCWIGRGGAIALVLVSACGGDGGGGSHGTAPPQFAVERAEAAAGVALSTGVALSSLLLEVEVSTAALLATMLAGSELVLPCDEGGERRLSCVTDGDASVFEAMFADCRESIGDGQSRVRRGRISVDAADPMFCLRGSTIGAAAVTSFEGFSSIVSDARGKVLNRAELDLAQRTALSGGGCLVDDGTRSIEGIFSLFEESSDLDFTVTARGLMIATSSTGATCRQRMMANGILDVTDRDGAQQYTETLRDLEITLATEGIAVLLDFAGSVSNSCLGEVDFVTTEPIRLTSLGGCPRDGTLSITLAGQVAEVRAMVGGGIAIDANGDGESDETVRNCRDASLARCAGDA